MNNLTQQLSTIITCCATCNKNFTSPPSAKRKYCSKQCFYKTMVKEGTTERRKQYSKNQYNSNKQYYSNYYQQNKQRFAEEAKIRRQDPKNKKQRTEYMDRRKQTVEFKEYHRLYSIEYRRLNKEKVNECIRSSYRKKVKQLKYKLKFRLRNRLYAALKTKNIKKQASAMNLIGCTIDELKLHIEALWLPNMSWNNHTNKGWHIDHIQPCNTFDLTDIEQQKRCFHYTNLRPLWSKDNLSRPKNGSDIL